MIRLLFFIFAAVSLAAAAQDNLYSQPAAAECSLPEEQPAEEQPLRPVFAAYTLELGSAHMADTYLSPITYRGWGAAFAYQRMQAMKFDPERWVMQLEGRVEIDRGRNLADNATMWRLDIAARWGMMRRWRDMLTPGLTLAVGGSTGIDGGALYNQRNGNNPASAKLAWTLNLTAYASYSVNIGRLPVTFSYQPTLPLLGAFFSPEYDELYYEIYLGNHSGLAHFAWPGNRFAMTNLLAADLRLGDTSLRLGYRNYAYSSSVENLVCNITTHAFVFGVSGEWLSANRAKGISPSTRIISAVY